MQQLSVGEEFADHRIDGLIGRGGMGLVYRATQLTLDRPVALKLITPDLAEDQGFRDRFRQECRLAASLDHPNIVAVHDAGEQDGRLYVTMRLVEGTDLRREIDDGGPLDPERAARIVAQIGDALDAAHARGLVHRDVKPGNVLLATPPGRQETAYLTDFGLSKQAGSSDAMTRTGAWVGTVDYVAPEQIQGLDVDARTDVYALGCVLYEALTGKAPFAHHTEVAKMFAHLNDPPPPLGEPLASEYPELVAVLARAMAKAPGDRYLSAGDLGRAALAAVAHKPVEEPERTVARGSARPAEETRISVPAQATEPPPTPPPPPATPARTLVQPAPDTPGQTGGGSRWPLIAAGVVALLAAAAAALAVGGVFSSTKTTTTIASTPTVTATATGKTPHGTPTAISHASVRSALTRYESAYSAQSLAAIRALLTVGVHRRSGTSVQNGRASALAEYARQFAALSRPNYALHGTRVTTTSRGATATARYTITDGGSLRGSGTIRFHFVRVGGRLKINNLLITVG